MRRFFALGLAAALLAGAAAAQSPPQAPSQSQSRPQAGAATAKPPRIFLSPSGEPFRLSSATHDPLRAWFDQADANHDGAIDRVEFRADATHFFQKLDENGDGTVDGFEAADYENKIAPELAEQAEGRLPGQFAPRDHGSQNDDRSPPRPGQPQTEPHRELHDAPASGPGRRIAQLIDEPEPVTGADFNLDSHITLEEWMRATDRRFDMLDTAKTGRLTLDQLRERLAHPPKPPKR